MTDIGNLTEGNARFVAEQFRPGLSINPVGNMMVIGCVDPRVDPGAVLGLENGEAAILRNVGGRITPATLRTLRLLRRVGQANPDGKQPGDWNLVILHHTDCGMTDLAGDHELLAEYFEIAVDDLPAKAVSDPHRSVAVDVDLIKATLRGPGFLVTGLVYDVETGLIEIVAQTAPLESEPAH